MNKIEAFAAKLNGREYSSRVLEGPEIEEARSQGVVILFGYSDDCAEFEGAINDEVSCYDGGTIYLSKEGLFDDCECESHCKWAKAARDKCRKVEAVWHDEGNPCWTYETDIPHATFDIVEDDEVFCRGIVFELSALEASQ